MSSIDQAVVIKPQGDIAVVELDLPNEKVNKLSSPVMMRLKSVIEELGRSSYQAVIFKSNKSKIFIAGADIEEIKNLKTKEQFEPAIKGGQDIFNMIEDLPMPTIAAINGACLGGGCEFSMACDYRIASDDNSTKIGLPEIQLGILPGFGGCVRMPRILGLQASLDIILAGKSIDAKKALKIGLVDQVVHQNQLLPVAVSFAKEVAGKGKRRKEFKPKGLVNKILESFIGRPIVFSQAKKGVLKATKGHYPAPLKALEVIKDTYGSSNREKSLEIERAGFCELGITDISKNLIHVFYLVEMVKKQTGVQGVDVKPKEVKHIGVLGAGTMGGGIAYVAADKGVSVRMKDINLEAISKGFKHAYDLWNKLVKKRKIDQFQFQQKMDLISGTTDYSGFKNLDVVIEAIVEDMGIKQKVIGETAKNMRPDAIIATNTSSLSVTEMANGHPKPEYFAGMHFFNPVHKMPLVEVIRGGKTSDETIATIFELTKKMGKMPVVVKDGPGFLVNRLLLPYLAEAAFLLQEGMDIKDVDKAYVYDFGMPMGPFELMDEIGIDVCIKVLKIFKKSFGDRVEIAEVMDKLDKSGRMGRKNNKGFYKYEESGKRGDVDDGIYSVLGLKSPSNPLSLQDCIERGIFAMVNECTRALKQDKIVTSPHEVDLAMIMGTGFPPFKGGLLKYADSVSASYVLNQLNKFSKNGQIARLAPSPQLMEMVQQGAKFYN